MECCAWILYFGLVLLLRLVICSLGDCRAGYIELGQPHPMATRHPAGGSPLEIVLVFVGVLLPPLELDLPPLELVQTLLGWFLLGEFVVHYFLLFVLVLLPVFSLQCLQCSQKLWLHSSALQFVGWSLVRCLAMHLSIAVLLQLLYLLE